MKRAIIWSIISLLILGFAGCGDDDPVVTKDPPVVIKPGLSGDTYMNTKFGIRISDLPVDEWTVKALGADGQGFKINYGQGVLPQYKLLLMEPVPDDEFVSLGSEGTIAPILDADVPFVIVFLDYDEGGSFESYNLVEELNSYAEWHGAEIESKKPVLIGDTSGTQAVLLRGDELKEALTWFAKDEVLVRCEYWAKESEFDKYYDVYISLVENTLLMGS